MITPLEYRTAFSLAMVYIVRMLGLFMVIPVLPLYFDKLTHSTPFLVGLAIGVYGFTQALFQIPLGLLSDKIGRKPVIVMGLLIFLLGSIIAALADNNINQIIIGRILQGMGAIAAATLALAADLTQEKNHHKIMAIIGISIAIAFVSAMIIGPIIDSLFGLSGVFWIIAGLALLAIIIVLTIVPTSPKPQSHNNVGIIRGNLLPVIHHAPLQRINIGIFFLHMMMTANFVVIPLIIFNELGLDKIDNWTLYAPIFIFSFLASIPFIILAEKKNKIKLLLMLSISLLIVAQIAQALYQWNTGLFIIGFFLFFISFNFLEATQPSMVAKLAPQSTKGTAMGLFTTFQFLGIFTGGILGGLLFEYEGAQLVFLLGVIACLIWLWIIKGLTIPIKR